MFERLQVKAYTTSKSVTDVHRLNDLQKLHQLPVFRATTLSRKVKSTDDPLM